MNAIYLHLPDGTPTKWSMCSECKTVAAPGNFDLSQKCCTCYDCGKPLPPDERTPYAKGRGKALYHRECERQRRARIDAEVLDNAELIADYKGPVYFEGLCGSYGDGYFSNVEELAERLDDQDDQSKRPEFTFCCEEHPFPGVRIDHLLESATEEMDEDASERLDGVEELQKACNTFNDLNKGVISYYEDRKHKCRIPPAQNTSAAQVPAGGNA